MFYIFSFPFFELGLFPRLKCCAPFRCCNSLIALLISQADYNEILEWIGYFESGPKKIFITHGEIDAAQSLKKKIEERFGCSVVIPKYLESFELD